MNYAGLGHQSSSNLITQTDINSKLQVNPVKINNDDTSYILHMEFTLI